MRTERQGQGESRDRNTQLRGHGQAHIEMATRAELASGSGITHAHTSRPWPHIASIRIGNAELWRGSWAVSSSAL